MKLLIILAAGVAVRLIFIFSFPIFNDESIYLTWGQGLISNPSRWWYWALDGKQPGLSALYGVLTLLPSDPLVSVRLSSLVFSLIALVSLYKSGRMLGTTGTAALLFAGFSPYFIIFGSLAMPEAAIMAGSSVALYLMVQSRSSKGRLTAVLAGLAIGISWWFKSTILLLVPAIIAGFFLLAFDGMKKTIARCMLFAFVVFLMMLPVKLNPDLANRHIETIDRFLHVDELVNIPVVMWRDNIWAALQWAFGYFPFPIILLSFVGFRMMRDRRMKWTLLGWIAIPTLATVIGLRAITARFLVVSAPAMILLSAFGFGMVRQKFVRIAVMVFIVASGITVSVNPLLFYNLLSWLPSARGDFGQYVSGWPSGWGVKEAVGYLLAVNREEPIAVIVRFDSGNPESAIFAYMNKNAVPSANVYDIPGIFYNELFAGRQWYFVSRGGQFAGLEEFLTEEKRFTKPYDDEFVGVYRIQKEKLAAAMEL